ncbi:MAG: hypothetical protein K0R99_1009 [Microbacterium sp.]|jgi:DNA-binding MarR family transcriptional regulator|uniref:MarR family winged helix-turn-helix transcriptional regulator n=1 Tax=Microbacterium sp. TaxID=51671 RepID=UPI0026083781|nr:MarR family transcriptional regulator [Microbacterium sp.]MDF2559563.1 hypothetical protein [Microbacterium sp.]
MSESEQMRTTPGALVWRLANRWRTAVDRAVGDLGLTHATYVVLTTLYAENAALRSAPDDAPSQRAIADASGLEPVYVSRLLRTLEREGMVSRVRDQTDTRIIRLHLTAHGLATVTDAMAAVQELLGRLLGPLGGLDSQRTSDFTRTLDDLLAAPLDDKEADA